MESTSPWVLNSRYFVALKSNLVHHVRHLVCECGVDVDSKFPPVAGQPALCIAVENNASIELLSCLIDLGASVNQCDQLGFTALHISVREKRFDLMCRLLTERANVNARTITGQTALHIAVLSNHFDIVLKLLKSGATVNVFDDEDATPLLVACAHNCSSSIIVQLFLYGANVCCYDRNGNSPLHYASQFDIDIVRLMLFQGAYHYINRINNVGLTPLLALSLSHNRNNATKVMNLLLKCGADSGIHDRFGRSALQNAITCRDEQMSIMLIKWGSHLTMDKIDCHCVDDQLYKYFMAAVKSKMSSVVDLLINDGLLLNQRSISAIQSFSDNVFDDLDSTVSDQLTSALCVDSYSPMSLLKCTRIMIRRLLAPQIVKCVSQLPISSRLVSFIQFE